MGAGGGEEWLDAVSSMTDKTLKKEWKDVFLDRLKKSPNVSAAAKAVGYSRGHVYFVRDQDPEFAKAWKEALDCGIDGAEGELYRRAVRGVVKKVFYQDKQIDTVREYSDTLLIFLLKSHKPDVYRETTRNEVSGPDGGAIVTKFVDYRENLNGTSETEG